MSIRKIVALSCKRRGKEMRLVRVVTFLVALFLAGILLYQQCAQSYVKEWARLTYGDWTLAWDDMHDSEVIEYLNVHSYLETVGILRKGQVLQSEPDEQFGIRSDVGTLVAMDVSMQDTSKLQFFEGRYPQNDCEIAVNTQVFSSMGLPYELDQEITFYYEWEDENRIIHGETVTYTVVGIINNYSSVWSEVDLSGIVLVTETEFESSAKNPIAAQFYSLKEMYSEIDVEQFYQSLNQEIMEKYNLPPYFLDGTLGYNQSRYDAGVWDTTDEYITMGNALILIGVTALIYLLLIYLTKRAPFYHRFRSIGTSKFNVYKMIFYECGVITGPLAVIGILLAYGVAIVSCKVIEKQENMRPLFQFDVNVLLSIVGSIGVTLLIVIFVAMWISGSNRIRTSSSELSKLCMIRLRRHKLSTKPIDQQLQRREWKRFPIRMLAMRLLALASAYTILVCATQLYREYIPHKSIMDAPDFDADVKTDYERLILGIYSVQQQYSTEKTFSDIFFKELETQPELNYYKTKTREEGLLFDWPGRTKSPVIKAFYETILYDNATYGDALNPIKENDRMIGYGIQFTDDPEMYETLEGMTDKVTWDQEAVLAGEEVIIVSRIYDMLGVLEPVRENTLQVGDTLMIESEDGKIQIPVRIGGIVYGTMDDLFYNAGMALFSQNYYAVASDTLGKRIAQERGLDYQPNHVDIHLKGVASYEDTVKQITTLLSMNDAIYFSQYESKMHSAEQFRQSQIIYIGFGSTILVFYLIIRESLWEAIALFRRKRIELLRKCGMEEARIRRMYRRDGVREFMYGLLTVPFVLWQLLPTDIKESKMTLIEFIDKCKRTPEMFQNMFNPEQVMICIGILVIITLLTMFLQEYRVIKKK